jgi:hypothetical protein
LNLALFQMSAVFSSKVSTGRHSKRQLDFPLTSRRTITRFPKKRKCYAACIINCRRTLKASSFASSAVRPSMLLSTFARVPQALGDVGEVLTPKDRHQLWIPEGFAHGFLALADNTEFLYKTSRLYDKARERSILWNDADIGIDWPLVDAPIVSDKDAEAPGFVGRKRSSDGLARTGRVRIIRRSL